MSPSEIDLTQAALAFRCFGCVVSLPLGETLSTFPRFLLAIGLSFVLLPGGITVENVSWLSLFTEFVIGFVLGAPLRFAADMSEMVGELIDTARGQMVSAVMDPLHGHGVSDLATLAKLSSVVVALMCGALEIVVSALARSVEVLPIGSPAHDASLMHGVLGSGAFLLGEGMRLCAVWVGAFLVIDIVCSILSRVVNGLTFCQAAVILKLLAAVLLLLVFVLQGDQLSQGWLTRVVAPWEWGAVSSPAPVVRDGARGPNAGTEVKK